MARTAAAGLIRVYDFPPALMMHELSIAHSLVEIAVDSAAEAGARRVTVVHLRLGVLSGVVRSALEFCYDIAAEGTLLEGSRLLVTEVPLVARCPNCEADVELPCIQLFRCPRCDAPVSDIRQGQELDIDSIECEVDSP